MSKSTFPIPMQSAITKSCARVNTCSRNASGIEARAIARATSATIMSGRRRTRSARTPVNSVSTRKGSRWVPISSPTTSALVWNSRIASVGRARTVISPPITLMV